MERMTVEQRDGLFVGVVQSLRGESWKTVVTLPETAGAVLGAVIDATASHPAVSAACPFVSPVVALRVAA